MSEKIHETWSSRLTFIMAAVGSAVGLGNFWRFPYEAGQNGGGAFVLIYLGVVLLIALPVLMAEYAIGRRTGLPAIGATREFAKESGSGSGWGFVGGIGMLTGFLILSFYSVIAGWVMAYVPMFFSGDLVGVTVPQAEQIYNDLVADSDTVVMWHSIFMAITVVIVARGLHGGIEVAANILMPAFFIMLLGMVIFAAIEGDLAAATSYLFSPDFSKINADVIVRAISQAFFSVGVASAIMITYGSYLDKDTNIGGASIWVASTDTMVALLAGFAIFPLVFMGGLDPNGGPGLLFQTLPAALGQLPFSTIIGGAFFILAFFAALTSAISLFEVVVKWGEENTGINRWFVAIVLGLVCWGVGLGSAYSTNELATFTPLPFWNFEGQTLFGILDVLTAQILLPLGGFLVAILAGWFISSDLMKQELGLGGFTFFIWQWLMRLVIPVAIAAVLIWSFLPQ